MKKNGFTLIETIGIIIVIALIATVTIPIIINNNDRNRIAEQEKADIKVAVDYYLNAHQDLKSELRSNGEITINSSALVNEGFIHEINYYRIIKVTNNEDGTYTVSFE